LDVRVVDVTGELRGDLDVLIDAVRPQALVALGQVSGLQCVGIEVDLADQCRYGGIDVHAAPCVCRWGDCTAGEKGCGSGLRPRISRSSRLEAAPTGGGADQWKLYTADSE